VPASLARFGKRQPLVVQREPAQNLKELVRFPVLPPAIGEARLFQINIP